MTQTTTGRFDITSWDEETYEDVSDDNGGARLVEARNTKAFQGGLTGTSSTRLLQALAHEGAAAYVAVERVEAQLDGRKGTFVLTHRAVGSVAGGEMVVAVVPNSGTGELAGLTGDLTIDRAADGEHTYTFTYSLPEQPPAG